MRLFLFICLFIFCNFEDTLRPLPLAHALVFRVSEKRQLISLYWFAAQQQTITFRHQKYTFYSKFNAQLNEPSFSKQQKAKQAL